MNKRKHIRVNSFKGKQEVGGFKLDSAFPVIPNVKPWKIVQTQKNKSLNRHKVFSNKKQTIKRH